jgi:general secretion pathway protein N
VIRAALVLVALLVGVLALQWKDWPPAPSTAGLDVPAGAGGQSGVPGDPDPLARLTPPEPRDSYASVTERPLFRPERKPEEPQPEDAADETQPEVATNLDGMDVSAVIITPALVAAWIRDPKAPDLKRLRLGDDLEGWSVKEIQSDRVVLERQGELDELLLRDFTKAQAPAAPTPPTARPRQTPATQRQGAPQQRPNVPRSLPQRPK